MSSLAIVIPVLDEAPRIGELLRELQPLRQAGVELVVADGGSRDGTPEIAAAFADAVIDAPRGRARQMNAGAAASRGDILLFLHADTLLPPAGVAAVMAAIEDGAQWGRFDVRIAGQAPLLRVVARMMNWRSRLTGIATGDQAMFVTRAAFDAVGGFPPIALMEDIALSRALRRLGRPASLAARVVTSGRRWDENGAWRTIFLMWRLRAAFFLGANPDTLSKQYRSRPVPVATAKRRKER